MWAIAGFTSAVPTVPVPRSFDVRSSCAARSCSSPPRGAATIATRIDRHPRHPRVPGHPRMPCLLCSEELDENLLRDVLRLVDVGEEQATEALDARALRVVELLIRGPC